MDCLRCGSFSCSGPLNPFPVLRNYGLIVNTRNFFSCIDYLSCGTVALDYMICKFFTQNWRSIPNWKDTLGHWVASGIYTKATQFIQSSGFDIISRKKSIIVFALYHHSIRRWQKAIVSRSIAPPLSEATLTPGIYNDNNNNNDKDNKNDNNNNDDSDNNSITLFTIRDYFQDTIDKMNMRNFIKIQNYV